MPHDLRLFHSGVGGMKDMFNKKVDQHKQAQLENPFSEWEGAGKVRRLSKEDVGYGRPIPGSESERRSEAAKVHIMMDIRYLCDMIWDCSEFKNPDGRAAISFGRLFKLYLSISDKVVGTLLRARKHRFVHFEGEMLYQRRDDNKVIELSRPINTIRAKFGQKQVFGGGEVEPWGNDDGDGDGPPPLDTFVRRKSTPGGTANRRLSLVVDDSTTSEDNTMTRRGRRFSAPHACRSLTASPERLMARCAAMKLEDHTDQETMDHTSPQDTMDHKEDQGSSSDKPLDSTGDQSNIGTSSNQGNEDQRATKGDHGDPGPIPPILDITINCEDEASDKTKPEVNRFHEDIERNPHYLSLEPEHHVDHGHGRPHRRSRSTTPTPMATILEDNN